VADSEPESGRVTALTFPASRRDRKVHDSRGDGPSRLSAMSLAPRPSRGLAHMTRLGLLVGAFVGLFAMHGLAAHGTTHADTVADLSVATMHGTMRETHAASVQPSVIGQQGTVEGHGHDGGMSLLGLCLAVLAGALVGLLWVRSTRAAVVARRRALLDLASTPFAALRDRDPPCLFELSIQRC
jgi:hypothetical protein